MIYCKRQYILVLSGLKSMITSGPCGKSKRYVITLSVLKKMISDPWANCQDLFNLLKVLHFEKFYNRKLEAEFWFVIITMILKLSYFLPRISVTATSKTWLKITTSNFRYIIVKFISHIKYMTLLIDSSSFFYTKRFRKSCYEVQRA